MKLIGPTAKSVEVPVGESRTVNAAAGEYYILVRYGNNPKAYRYAKGDPFIVTQTATEYSATSITLHKVIGGNYPTRPASSKEFDDAVVTMEGAAKDDGKKPGQRDISTSRMWDTGIIDAAIKGDLKGVQSLLAKGADVNAKRSDDGATALYMASQEGHTEVVKELLAKGADVNIKAGNGATALIIASKESHTEVVKELLAKGADVN
ncbi:MAG TPA: ankyrin repeat domain-containing protein, partial [Thermodesulfobacteriota bacterium]|nr:ankyrin repeat domain-containing protein [Thermodesulfobacteriota bacterium]